MDSFEFDIQGVIFNKDSRLLIKYRIDGTAPGGEQVCWKTSYVDSENEIISQFLCQTITNSFDPNDLHVFPVVGAKKIIYSMMKKLNI